MASMKLMPNTTRFRSRLRRSISSGVSLGRKHRLRGFVMWLFILTTNTGYGRQLNESHLFIDGLVDSLIYTVFLVFFANSLCSMKSTHVPLRSNQMEVFVVGTHQAEKSL